MIFELIRWSLVILAVSFWAALIVGARIEAGRGPAWLRDTLVPPCGCPDDCERSGR